MLEPRGLSLWEKAVQARQVEGHRDTPAVNFRQHTVLVRVPFGKSGEIVPDLGAVGVKQMGPVQMDHHPVLVQPVVGIPSNMPSAVDNKDAPIEPAGQPLCEDRAREACANNQKIIPV